MTHKPPRALMNRIEAMAWAPAGGSSVRGGSLRLVRTILILGRDLAFGQLTLHAMSLVYTTLLSIVPLLALSFSVLKAFGVTNQIQPLLVNLLSPLGDQGAELALRITGFIENMNVGVLGAVGLVLLLYTSISLVQKIEESLNYIWHAPRPRPLGERFTRYLTVLMVGPILVFSALAVTAMLLNIEMVRGLMALDVLGLLVKGFTRVLPYLLIIAAFTFVYLFIPNTRVRLGPALVGGMVGGIAWQTAGWVFGLFIAGSTRYEAIYASFAIMILFMIWLYVSWLVLLFGASVAFYVQHPEYLVLRAGEPRLSNRMRERLALSAMELVARRFIHGEAAPSQQDFTEQLRVPGHVLMVVLDALERNGMVAASADDPTTYLPARDPGRILVADVMEAVREAGEEGFLSPSLVPTQPAVEQVVAQMQKAATESLADVTLRDLVQQGDDARVPPKQPAPVRVEPAMGS